MHSPLLRRIKYKKKGGSTDHILRTEFKRTWCPIEKSENAMWKTPINNRVLIL